MADRCSASITIGGTLGAVHLPTLLTLIEREGLTIDYDDGTFDPGDLVSGEPLTLCAHEVSWGSFKELEPFCRAHQLAYSRWNGACAGVWGCGRSVYRGIAEPRDGGDAVDEYDVSEGDILIGEQLARKLGTFDAVLAHFAAADFQVPSLVIEPDTAACSGPDSTIARPQMATTALQA
jgi:hypothetical protein